MQNFTFGRKGTNWFLFAFVLLIGTLPSFGQEDCPEAGDFPATQDFCYLETIDDLDTDGNPVFQTNREGDNQPIPGDELLERTTYFIGGEDCAPENRLPLEVVVDSQLRPINQITESRTQGFEFTTCASENFNAENLASLFQAEENSSYEIEVYESEFGETPYNGVLAPGGSYFVGQVSPNDDECPSLRTAVGFNPNQIEGPSADAAQTFCEEATVADLNAEGTYDDTQAIRWYRSQTANSPLSEGTELINGVTYFAAQVVNERGSITPPCETPSGERTPVEVTLEPAQDAGSDNTGEVCESDVEETFPSENAIENFYLSLLEDGVPRDGTFSPGISQMASQYQNDEDGLGDFTTTYTIGEDGCQDSVDLTISVVAAEEAEAGTIDDILVECGNEDPIELNDSLLSEDATTGGTFSGEGVNENGNFDPTIGPGTYEITYSVDDSQDCVIAETSSETIFFITVPGSDELPDEIAMEMCILQAQSLLSNPTQAEAFFTTLLTENGITNLDGDFNDAAVSTGLSILEYINSNPTAPRTFGPVIYTITSDCGEESVDITLTINNTEEPNAGPISPAPVCASATPFNLFSLLGEENDANGTFSDENGDEIADGLINVSEMGNFPITYTVTESDENCTEGEPDSTDFTLVVNEGTVAESPAPVFVCQADVPTLFPSVDEIRKYYIAIAQRAGFPTNGTISPNGTQLAANYQADEDGLGDFTTTYTFGGGDCQTSVDLTVTVVENADAGEDGTVTLNEDDEPINLFDFLEGTPMAGGTWSLGDGTFNPATDEEGVFTYTVSLGSCRATATVTVTVEEETDPTDPTDPECPTDGDIIIGEVCITDVAETFPSVDEIRKYYLSLLGSEVASNGTFNPRPAQIAAIYQDDEDGLGDFTTTYTLDNEDCEASVQLTVRVIDTVPAEAGDIDDQELCSNEGMIDLSNYLEGSGAVEGGTFTGEGVEDNMFDTSLGSNENGYTITYTVSEDNDACVEGEDATTFTIMVNDAPNAGPDVNETYCIAEVEGMLENPQDAIAWFNELIEGEDIDQDGNFDPAIETLALQVIAYVSNPGEPSATFETTYTVSNENCEDSTTISLTINNIEEADAGDFVNYTFCSNDEDINLNDEIEQDATMGGMFMINGEQLENGIFSPSMMEAGTYEVTYSVDESIECVEGEDLTTFEIEIIQGANAGNDNSTTICNQDIQDGMFLGEGDLVREFYLNLLDEGVSREGTFSPSLQEFVDDYESGNQIGTFTTVYTVGEGECTDTVELSVTVVETLEAEVGEIADQTICSSDEDLNLYDLITSGNEDGTFEGYEDGIFSPSMMEAGSYEVTYTVNEETPCVEGEASTTFTITVEQGANAGEDMDVSVCTNDDLQDLFSLISADADMDGEFTLDGEVITDGIMDPSAFEAGNYEVIYTVIAGEDAECGGDDTATITITLGAAPEAPTTGDAVAFCAIDGATAALLDAEGTNLTWYSDADLSMMVSEEDLLVNGEYYVTQSSDEGCESEAAMIMVNIVDSPAPTISSSYELCESNNPTISDLTAEINETGEVTWYDSANSATALNNNARLVDGTTYYATLISDNGCESSERLAVTVNLERCAIIPEAITPNDDNRNDTFSIGFLENDYPNFNVTIFNRWGNAVYKGNASTPEWDGTSNQSGSLGEDVLPVGVYFYVIDFNDGSTEPRQGKVYLNR